MRNSFITLVLQSKCPKALWKMMVRMSQPKNKNVLVLIEKFVEKEMNDFPALEMKDIRQLVLSDLALRNTRIETQSSAYRKLSRCLENAFSKPRQKPIESHPYVTINGQEPEHYKPHLSGLFYTKLHQSSK
jgi:hypothetical protein